MSMDGDRTEVARIMLGHSSVVTIHTGNVINWNLLKKIRHRPHMTSSDELMDGLHCVMKSWIRSINIDPLNIPEPVSHINVSNVELVTPIDPTHRKELKLSVKLFMCDWKPEVIQTAVDKVIHDLNVQRIDSLLVSFPVTVRDSPELSLDPTDNVNSIAADFDKIKPVWKQLECIVDSGNVNQIGVCDFDQTGLKLLVDWARIKPSVNQINLTNCCAVPNELVQYSTDQSIELLTHNDPPEIVSAHGFQSFVADSTEDGTNTSDWTPTFIARYAVLVRYRGIVHSKGYIISAERRNIMALLDDYGFF